MCNIFAPTPLCTVPWLRLRSVLLTRLHVLLFLGLFSGTVTPLRRRGRIRFVGGDEKEGLESETVKYGHESHGGRTRK
jgi:hypothetical protein